MSVNAFYNVDDFLWNNLIRKKYPGETWRYIIAKLRAIGMHIWICVFGSVVSNGIGSKCYVYIWLLRWNVDNWKRIQ